jgi:hypothetical protein
MKKLKTVKSIIDKAGHIGIDGIVCKILHNTMYCCGLEWKYLDVYYAKKVTEYIRDNYSYICESFQNRKMNGKHIQRIPKNAKIFTFWNNSNPPSLIESCFESQRRNAGKHQHVILTDKTVPDYCNIPGYIWDKYHQKKMPVQTFSDILRFSLLYEHGGLWLDSTIFVAKAIPDFVFSSNYWQHKHKASSPFARKYDYFGLSAFASLPHNIVPDFCRECFYAYWLKEEKLIEYFFITIFLSMGIDNVKIIGDLFFAIPENNTNIYALIKLQDKSFDLNLWRNIISEEREVGFFKMNWRNPPQNKIGSFWYELNKNKG